MTTQIRNQIISLITVLLLTGLVIGEAHAQVQRVLPVPLLGQETSMWCWAATTQMTVQYNGTATQQCVEANAAFGRNDCCQQPNACVFGGWPNYPRLGYNTLTSNWGTALTWEQLKAEINVNRPVNFSWGWAGGGGHIMVAVGYYEAPGMQYVLVNDPWPPRNQWTSGGEQKWITYAKYVAEAGSHSHWMDYYNIRRAW